MNDNIPLKYQDDPRAVTMKQFRAGASVRGLVLDKNLDVFVTKLKPPY
jgi:hypothetical protein